MALDYIDEEEFAETEFDVSVWKKIFAFLKPLKKELIIALAMASVLALSDIGYPLLNRFGIDTIIASGSLD